MRVTGPARDVLAEPRVEFVLVVAEVVLVVRVQVQVCGAGLLHHEALVGLAASGRLAR